MGLDEALVTAILDDWRTAPVDARMRAALAFVEKLTLTPAEMPRDDVKEARAAGLTRRALQELAYVTYLFSVMDRLADAFDFPLPNADQLKASGGSILGPIRRRRGGLSGAGQIALAVVLVMSAALLTRSALQWARPNPRFNLKDKLVIQLDLLSAGYDRTRSIQACEALADHLASLPEVKAVGASPRFFFGGVGPMSIYEYTPGGEEGGARRHLARWVAVTDVGRDYFTALEIPLLKELQSEYGDRIDIIGVAIDDMEAVREYAVEAEFNYPVLVGQQDAVDLGNRVLKDWIGLPFTAFVDASGTIRHVHVGEIHREQAEGFLRSIL